MIGQSNRIKTVLITKSSVIVPEGKRWSLVADIPTRIQISNGSLQSGTMCNANLLSSPNIITSINKGSRFNPELFGIIFKQLDKIPYTNQNTFEITPIFFTGRNFSIYDLQRQKIEDSEKKSVEFLEGDTLYVGNCLESIEMIETSLTKKETGKVVRCPVANTKVADTFQCLLISYMFTILKSCLRS